MFEEGWQSTDKTAHNGEPGDFVKQRWRQREEMEERHRTNCERPFSWVLRLDKVRAGAVIRVGIVATDCPDSPSTRMTLKRKKEEIEDVWRCDCNWNDRRAVHKVWYLDSNGDVYAGGELKGETGWKLTTHDLIAVTVGHNKLVFSTRQGSYGIHLEDPPTDADAESMPESMPSADGRTFATKITCAESRTCVACEKLSVAVQLVSRGDSVSLLAKSSFSSVGTTEISRCMSRPPPVSSVSRDFCSNGFMDNQERGGEGGRGEGGEVFASDQNAPANGERIVSWQLHAPTLASAPRSTPQERQEHVDLPHPCMPQQAGRSNLTPLHPTAQSRPQRKPSLPPEARPSTSKANAKTPEGSKARTHHESWCLSTKITPQEKAGGAGDTQRTCELDAVEHPKAKSAKTNAICSTAAATPIPAWMSPGNAATATSADIHILWQAAQFDARGGGAGGKSRRTLRPAVVQARRQRRPSNVPSISSTSTPSKMSSPLSPTIQISQSMPQSNFNSTQSTIRKGGNEGEDRNRETVGRSKTSSRTKWGGEEEREVYGGGDGKFVTRTSVAECQSPGKFQLFYTVLY